jgi:hypothetical protein
MSRRSTIFRETDPMPCTNRLQTYSLGGDDDADAALQANPRGKAISRPAKRNAGARTPEPSLRPVRAVVAPSARATGVNAGTDPIPMPDASEGSTSLVVHGLRPRQVLAATLLIQGRQGKDVAATLKVAEETVSRWRQQDAFQALMGELLQQHVDAMRLNMIALTGEAITHLRYLVNGFSDDISLKACALALNKAGPILSAIGAELRHPPV